MLQADIGLQSALFDIHSQQQNDSQDKEECQGQNCETVRSGCVDQQGEGEGTEDRGELRTDRIEAEKLRTAMPRHHA